jgi:hypothetical protein
LFKKIPASQFYPEAAENIGAIAIYLYIIYFNITHISPSLFANCPDPLNLLFKTGHVILISPKSPIHLNQPLIFYCSLSKMKLVQIMKAIPHLVNS